MREDCFGRAEVARRLGIGRRRFVRALADGLPPADVPDGKRHNWSDARLAQVKAWWMANRANYGRKKLSAARQKECCRLWASGRWTQPALALRFGVHQTTVSRLVAGLGVTN